MFSAHDDLLQKVFALIELAQFIQDPVSGQLNNSDEEIELADILQWLAGYSGVGIKIEGEK